MSTPNEGSSEQPKGITIFEAFVNTLPKNSQELIRGAACLEEFRKKYGTRTFQPDIVTKNQAYSQETPNTMDEISALISEIERLQALVPTSTEVDALRVDVKKFLGRLRDENVLNSGNPEGFVALMDARSIDPKYAGIYGSAISKGVVQKDGTVGKFEEFGALGVLSALKQFLNNADMTRAGSMLETRLQLQRKVMETLAAQVTLGATSL